MGVLPWAGSEELWHGAAMNLLGNAHQVSIFYPRHRGWAPPMDLLQNAGAKVHAYGPGRNTAGQLWSKVRRIWGHPGADLAHPDWLKSDLVVICQGACMDGLEWLEKVRDTRKPYVIVCQANMESHWPDDGQAERLNQVFSAARAVCFVSAENERLFRIQTGYEGTNTSLVWNPLQPETPQEPLPWPRAPDDGWRMAMVGRIEPFAKGQDLMLEVLSMDKWRERQLNITIYGKGPWEQTARKIAQQRNLTKIQFGGFATPREIWSVNHILALPSRHEGMSLAMLEAMWLGRPVVATAVAGAVSEIIQGSNGFLAPAASVELWDQAMEQAWENRDHWQDMGRAAALRIRERRQSDPSRQFTEILINVAGLKGKAAADFT